MVLPVLIIGFLAVAAVCLRRHFQDVPHADRPLVGYRERSLDRSSGDDLGAFRHERGALSSDGRRVLAVDGETPRGPY